MSARARAISAVTLREFARKVFGGQWPILLVGLILSRRSDWWSPVIGVAARW